MENIKTLIQENKDCKMEKGVLCAQHCRDCRYMEMENDHYNDGNRRCAYTKDAGCHPVRKLVQHFNGKDALYEC